MSLAEWVRQTLRQALQQLPSRNAERKLECVRAATRHAFPTGDIEQVIREIEPGYTGKA